MIEQWGIITQATQYPANITYTTKFSIPYTANTTPIVLLSSNRTVIDTTNNTVGMTYLYSNCGGLAEVTNTQFLSRSYLGAWTAKGY